MTLSVKTWYVIIIMYIYHALINAQSTHTIRMNLNMIFYTHVEHSPTKTIYIKHTHTHKHSDCSKNWVLILGWKYCEKRKVFSLALKDDRVEQCLRSCGSEFQMWGPKQENVRNPRVLRLYCWISSLWVSEEEHSV